MEKSRNLTTKNFDKKLKIAILNSFTINGLEESLRVRCADEKIQSISYVGGYNQYMQEILDEKSGLYSFKPEITFLILDVRSIFGENYFFPYDISAQKRKEFVKNKTNELTDLVRSFMKKSNSKLVITNLLVPSYTSFGILETKYKYGFHEMICDFNSTLSSNLRDESGVYVYDFDQFVKKYGERNVFDYRKYFFGDIKISLDYIPILAYDLMGYIKPMTSKNRKCIVLDLDNTLWGGIVGEDGFDGISLGPTYPGNAFVEFQRLLLALWRRGIILAINSKNNPDDALQVIREHPYMILKEEHFASIRI
ncbi:MAG: HAD-IIIC family phosphatase, partial [Bacteroidia bacterium]|nr:HAD-IIIC family phosphatase [Bacteroidia bacterium]